MAIIETIHRTKLLCGWGVGGGGVHGEKEILFQWIIKLTFDLMLNNLAACNRYSYQNITLMHNVLVNC